MGGFPLASCSPARQMPRREQFAKTFFCRRTGSLRRVHAGFQEYISFSQLRPGDPPPLFHLPASFLFFPLFQRRFPLTQSLLRCSGLSFLRVIKAVMRHRVLRVTLSRFVGQSVASWLFSASFLLYRRKPRHHFST